MTPGSEARKILLRENLMSKPLTEDQKWGENWLRSLRRGAHPQLPFTSKGSSGNRWSQVALIFYFTSISRQLLKGKQVLHFLNCSASSAVGAEETLFASFQLLLASPLKSELMFVAWSDQKGIAEIILWVTMAEDMSPFRARLEEIYLQNSPLWFLVQFGGIELTCGLQERVWILASDISGWF